MYIKLMHIRTLYFVKTNKEVMEFEVRQDHELILRTSSSHPCAKPSKWGLAGVCSWDSSCSKSDLYSRARKPSYGVIPTAPAMRWSPQITCIKYSLRDSKASFHWVCFKFLSNTLYFFLNRYVLYFYWLFRKERKKTSSRPWLHTFIFF